jgi:mycoketide-CoA synthase
VVDGVSTVTGGWVSEWVDPEYWVRQVRSTVRFHDAVTRLVADDVTTFVEVGPDAVLTGLVAATLPDDGRTALPTMRRDQPEELTIAGLFGNLLCRGVPVDPAAFPPISTGSQVPLPTYPFQRQRYWLQRQPQQSNGLGSSSAAPTHPMLDAVIEVAARGETLLTGRLPEVADGERRSPTVFAELALAVGRNLGAPVVRQLDVHLPLPPAVTGDLPFQVCVGPPEADNQRRIVVHVRADSTSEWAEQATGVLAADDPSARTRSEGVGAAGRDVSVGVAPERTAQAERCLLSPEIWDGIVPRLGSSAPVAWRGLRIDVAGASTVRARIERLDDDSVSVALFDDAGKPVGYAERIVYRDIAEGAAQDRLFEIAWQEIEEPGGLADGSRTGAAALGTAGSDEPVVTVWSLSDADPADPVGSAHALVDATRSALGERLAERSGQLPPLVVVTRAAVAVDDSEVVDPAAAAVWGLVRSIQAAEPGRVVLVDIDSADRATDLADSVDRTDSADLADLSAAVLVTGEPLVAARNGRLWRPRLVTRVSEPAADAGRLTGRILVTSGVGQVGEHVVRQLAGGHGVTDLIVLDPGGPRTAAAERMVAGFATATTRVRVVAGDVTDLSALADLLAAEQVDAVVHALGDQSPPYAGAGRSHPLVDGTWHLHTLTGDREVAFVVLVTAGGMAGGQEDPWTAAAESFTEAVVRQRRSSGCTRPATVIGLTRWDDDPARATGAGAGLAGFRAVTPAEGDELLEAALAADRPALIAAPFTHAGLVPSGPVPHLLRALVPDRGGAEPPRASLLDRLAEMDDAQRLHHLLATVRSETAAVLGLTGSARVPAGRAFSDLGMDSMTAVELRDRLAGLTGVRMPATAVFDNPTPHALTQSLLTRLAVPRSGADPGAAPSPGGADADPLESANAEELFALIDEELGGTPH